MERESPDDPAATPPAGRRRPRASARATAGRWPPVRRGLRAAHRVANALLLAGLVVQFYAAGWAAFGNPFTFHAVLGWALIPLALLSALLALAGTGRDRRSALAAALVGVLALQPVLVFVLSAISIAITALHPVNGLLAVALSVRLETLARRPSRGASGPGARAAAPGAEARHGRGDAPGLDRPRSGR